VLLIGAAADRIAKELSGAAELVPAGDLATAVREAFRRAEPGDTVLLAPACSSFDQFQDFEHRGRVFKELVHALAREVEEEQVSGSRDQVSGKNQGRHPTPGTGHLQVVSAETPAREPEPAVGAHRDAPPPETPRGPATPLPEAVGPGLAPASSGETPASAPEATVGAHRDAPPPEAPASSRPLELVYVYEVGAEELPGADLEPPPQFVDDASLPAPETFAPPGTVEDEALPFEARQGAQPAAGAGAVTAAGSGPEDALAGQKRGEAGRGEGKNASPNAESSGAPTEGPRDSKVAGGSRPKGGQPRLPGME